MNVMNKLIIGVVLMFGGISFFVAASSEKKAVNDVIILGAGDAVVSKSKDDVVPAELDGEGKVCSDEFSFNILKGTLKENVKKFVDANFPGYELIYKVGRHTVYSDTCITSDSVEGVLQKMIGAYTSPENIYFMTFDNAAAVVFYENDPEFSKYLRFAR